MSDWRSRAKPVDSESSGGWRSRAITPTDGKASPYSSEKLAKDMANSQQPASAAFKKSDPLNEADPVRKGLLNPGFRNSGSAFFEQIGRPAAASRQTIGTLADTGSPIAALEAGHKQMNRPNAEAPTGKDLASRALPEGTPEMLKSAAGFAVDVGTDPLTVLSLPFGLPAAAADEVGLAAAHGFEKAATAISSKGAKKAGNVIDAIAGLAPAAVKAVMGHGMGPADLIVSGVSAALTRGARKLAAGPAERGLKALSEIALNSPEILSEPATQALAASAGEGGASLVAAHNFLMQNDKKYNKAINDRIAGSKDSELKRSAIDRRATGGR